MKGDQLFDIFFLSLLLSEFIETLKQAGSSDFRKILASSLGWAVTLIIWPDVFTLLIKWVAKLFNFEFFKKAFFRIFLKIWVICALYGFVEFIDASKNYKR